MDDFKHDKDLESRAWASGFDDGHESANAQGGDGGGDAGGSDGYGPGKASALMYDAQEQRARVREKVRNFTDEIEAMWRGRVNNSGELLAGSGLDAFMTLGYLNEYRFGLFRRMAGRTLATLTLLTLAAIAGFTTCLVLGFNLGSLVTEDLRFSLIIHAGTALIALLIISGFAWLMNKNNVEKQEDEAKHHLQLYLAGVRGLAGDIRDRIGEQIRDESATVQSSQAKLNSVVYSEAEAVDVKEGIIEMMRSWRRLERLPYYLRHRWDLYFNALEDQLELPKYKLARLRPAVLVKAGPPVARHVFPAAVALIAITAIAETVSWVPNWVPGWLPGVLTAAGWVLALVLCAIGFFGLSWALHRMARTSKTGARPSRSLRLSAVVLSMYVFGALVCLVYFTLSGLPIWSAPVFQPFVDAAAPSLMGILEPTMRVFVSLLAVSGVTLTWFISDPARRAEQKGEEYKHTARRAAAQIVVALRTHQKRDVLSQFNCTLPEFLALLDDPQPQRRYEDEDDTVAQTGDDADRKPERGGEPAPDGTPGDEAIHSQSEAGAAAVTWNGWYEGYEDARRAELVAQGYDEDAVTIQLATDSIIYVGEEYNRRLEVSRFDATSRLVSTFPHVRTGP